MANIINQAQAYANLKASLGMTNT